jgi:hypothetical protein
MELNELKKAWGKVSEAKDQNHLVDDTEIRQMLSRKGKGILSKLERNVKTGFWLLGIFILLTIADQYLPYDRILNLAPTEPMKIPVSVSILGVFVNMALMFTFVLFVYRFHKLNIRSLATNNLEVALRKVIQLLDTFKKEFYLALIFFLCAEGAGFIMGILEGIGSVSNLKSFNLSILFTAGLVVLGIMALIIGLIFYVFHKGFTALYGKYRQQLIRTLNELDETEE